MWSAFELDKYIKIYGAGSIGNHLTNAAIQKENKASFHAENPSMQDEESMNGSKIPLHGTRGLWQRLENKGIDVDLIWRNICLLITKSLVVVDEKMSHQPCAFEVFGYDIILDDGGHMMNQQQISLGILNVSCNIYFNYF